MIKNSIINYLTQPLNIHEPIGRKVEGKLTATALADLNQGVDIRINKKTHRTLPAKVVLLDPLPAIEERDPPVRFRAKIPTTWIQLTLIEGKNRQVRRMCAKVGFPVLRLMRRSIGRLQLEKIGRGEFVELKEADIYQAFDF